MISDASSVTIDDAWEDIKLSKWMTTWDKNNVKEVSSWAHSLFLTGRLLTRQPKIKGFYECYDATDSVESKNIMKREPIETIQAKDTVLVEAHIARQRSRDAKSPYGGWDTWNAFLQLKAVSLIQRVPADQHVHDDEDDAEDEDGIGNMRI